jgi:glutamate N-acetyltransferase/amino-acid N-acetyltransferase
MKKIDGGVTAPQGFLAAGINVGVKPGSKKKDLAVVYSVKKGIASAVYTKNKFKAPPLFVTEENLINNEAQAIIVNSGCANACTGDQGKTDALKMTELTADVLGIDSKDIIVASTGVIGVYLPMEKIEKGIKEVKNHLSKDGGTDASLAIMTTDTVNKEFAYEFEMGGKKVRIGGMAKGSGMIHPNMATMLGFLTTDAAVSKDALKDIFKDVIDDTFNMISVDGDTSTNDMVCILANGEAGNTVIEKDTDDYFKFKEVVRRICEEMSISIVNDGEGATKLLIIKVLNALSKDDARKAARSISTSSLVKTAFFGEDANWGRIITALGYSGAEIDPSKCDIFLGNMIMAKQGKAMVINEEEALEILKKREIEIVCNLNIGSENAVAWTCDLSYEYIKINAEYRS